jgi:chloramphenicol 3-O-phosphotransferase
MHQMRTALTVAVSTALMVLLNAGTEAGKTCISTATEALPRIVGLVVKSSRTRPVPPAILASWKGQSRPIIVDVDTEAAGEAQTYSYMCVVTKGAAFVQRTMN